MNGGSTCDGASLIEQQKMQIAGHYLDQSGVLSYTPVDISSDSDQPTVREIVSAYSQKDLMQELYSVTVVVYCHGR